MGNKEEKIENIPCFWLRTVQVGRAMKNCKAQRSKRLFIETEDGCRLVIDGATEGIRPGSPFTLSLASD